MPKLKTGHISSTVAEDAEITRAALADPDAMPFTDAEWVQAKPRARIGRPALAAPKLATTLRLAPDTLARWRASGKGWQTRAAQVLDKNAPR